MYTKFGKNGLYIDVRETSSFDYIKVTYDTFWIIILRKKIVNFNKYVVQHCQLNIYLE